MFRSRRQNVLMESMIFGQEFPLGAKSAVYKGRIFCRVARTSTTVCCTCAIFFNFSIQLVPRRRDPNDVDIKDRERWSFPFFIPTRSALLTHPRKGKKNHKTSKMLSSSSSFVKPTDSPPAHAEIPVLTSYFPPQQPKSAWSRIR